MGQKRCQIKARAAYLISLQLGREATKAQIEQIAMRMHGNRYEWPLPEFAEHREDYRTMARGAAEASADARIAEVQALGDDDQ